MTDKINRRKKIITYLVMALTFFNLLVVDVNVISTIANKSTEEYMTVGAGAYTKKLKQGTVETTFVPVSNRIKQISLHGVFSAKEKDKLEYWIINSDGEELCHQKSILISEAYDSRGQRLPLEVAGIDFQRGNTYQLKLSFDMTKKAEISMDQNGIVLTQEYVVSYRGWLYGLLVAIHLLIAGFLFAVYRWGFNDKVYLAMLIAVGLFAVVLCAPFSRDDEFRHFVRVYDLATGQKYFHYGDMPDEVYGVVTTDSRGEAAYVEIPADADALRQMDYNNPFGFGGYYSEGNTALCLPKLQTLFSQPPEQDRVWVSAAGTYGRPLCAYWPQVLMVLIGNLLGVRGALLYYMAKTGQMIVVSLMYWLAWKLAPDYKYLFGAFALIPANILLWASCSSDGLMIAEGALGIAMILHAKDNKVSVRTRRGILYWGFFTLLVICIMKTKLPYAMICLGFLPVLIEKKSSKKTFGVLAAVGVGVLAVLFVRRDVVQKCMEMLMSAEHWQYWMNHFGQVSYMMLRKGGGLLVETLRECKGNGCIPYSCLLLLAALFTKRKFDICRRLYSLLLFFMMLLGIVMFGYSLMPPGYEEIWGVSYRYVLPFLPLFLLVLPSGKESTEKVLDACYPILLIPVVFASLFSFGMF